MEQIIKSRISNYLQLCVEAGFSQIQSHFNFTISYHYMFDLQSSFKFCSCWLSDAEGTIWAFVGPMLLIILVSYL